MAFFKDKFGAFMFIFTYISILLQVIGVYCTWDTNPSSFLIFYKIIFYIVCFLAVWSHLRASFTNPGIISYKNNREVVEFYFTLHEVGISRAEQLSQTTKRNLYERIQQQRTLDDEEDDDISDYDETEYKPVTSIEDETVKKINSSFKIQLTRCAQCYVVRTPRVHHCSLCKGCIMKMDHHCPWINNCVGQFTQKFFILFCFYCFWGCLLAVCISVYYMIYRHKKEFASNLLLIGIIVFQLVFAVIFMVFTLVMIYEQLNIIQHDSTLIDLKQKRILEKRDVSEVMIETFGCPFNLSWFFPLKVGGFLPFFNQLKVKSSE